MCTLFCWIDSDGIFTNFEFYFTYTDMLLGMFFQLSFFLKYFYACIQDDVDNPQLVVEYVRDIYNYLRVLEREQATRPDYLEGQTVYIQEEVDLEEGSKVGEE